MWHGKMSEQKFLISSMFKKIKMEKKVSIQYIPCTATVGHMIGSTSIVYKLTIISHRKTASIWDWICG